MSYLLSDSLMRDIRWTIAETKRRLLRPKSGRQRAGRPNSARWWGMIHNQGPDGEADFEDNRYWVISARPTGGGSSGPVVFVATESADPLHRIVAATNVTEGPGQHTLTQGWLVDIRIMRAADEAEAIFVFVGPPTVAGNATLKITDAQGTEPPFQYSAVPVDGGNNEIGESLPAYNADESDIPFSIRNSFAKIPVGRKVLGWFEDEAAGGPRYGFRVYRISSTETCG